MFFKKSFSRNFSNLRRSYTELAKHTPSPPTLLEIQLRELRSSSLPTHLKNLQEQKLLYLIERDLIYKRRLQVGKVFLGISVAFIGLYALWAPLYKTICESQGFSVKTHSVDYSKKADSANPLVKVNVVFHTDVDFECPWEFLPLQPKVTVSPGETALVFYKARNKSKKATVGLAIYDIFPNSLSLYFNKIQCFCFENQMLGPEEEVDLPLFFFIDPSIVDSPDFTDDVEITLRYTFYFAKKQNMAEVMQFHIDKHNKEQTELNKRKEELNKKGRKYKIEENRFSPIPGLSPLLLDSKLEENR